MLQLSRMQLAAAATVCHRPSQDILRPTQRKADAMLGAQAPLARVTHFNPPSVREHVCSRGASKQDNDGDSLRFLATVALGTVWVRVSKRRVKTR